MNDDGQRARHGDGQIAALLRPAVVAIVGVSSDSSKLGSVALQNVVRCGFAGRVYAVAREPIATDPSVTVVRSIEEIDEVVDIAMCAVPADRLLNVLRSVPRAKVRLAVAIASGFSETGSQGRQLEADVREYCATQGLPLIGPNCQGVVVPDARLQMTFSPMFNSMVSGSVAIVAQSGALGAYMANRLMQRGTGVRCFVSSGNETCLDAADYIELFGADPKTTVILCYLEQLRRGDRFVSAVRSLPPDKRVIVVKSGRTSAGVHAASTHTGAIASDDSVVSGVFEQLGVLRANDSAAAVDAASALAAGRVLRGCRVGVLSIAGGLAVELSDLLEMGGFEVPEFSPAIRNELKTIVPAFGAIRNPIDLTGAVLSEGGRFRDALEVLARADVDALAIISTYVADPQYAHAIVNLFRSTDKPVMVCWTGTVEQTPEALHILAEAKVPVFDNTARTAAAFRALLDGLSRKVADLHEGGAETVMLNADPTVRATLDAWRSSGRQTINEVEAKQLLSAAGLPLPRQEGYAGNSVVKICSDTHLHKTDFGLVRLNVATADLSQVRRELSQRADAAGAKDGVILVEEMIADGLLEWFVGFKRDRTFGPIIVVGAGGIFAESLGVPQIRLAPIDPSGALQMIKTHPAYPAISGARKRPVGDAEEFARVISRASQFFANYAEAVAEMDLNPIIVRPASVARRGEASVVIADAALKLVDASV